MRAKVSWLLSVLLLTLLSAGCGGKKEQAAKDKEKGDPAGKSAGKSPDKSKKAIDDKTAQKQKKGTVTPKTTDTGKSSTAGKTPAKKETQTQQVNLPELAYVPKDASGVLIIHPQGIMNSPALKSVPFAEGLESELGIPMDPKTIERFVLTLPAVPSPEVEENPFEQATWMVTFNKDIDAKAQLTELWGELEEAKAGNKTYYRRPQRELSEREQGSDKGDKSDKGFDDKKGGRPPQPENIPQPAAYYDAANKVFVGSYDSVIKKLLSSPDGGNTAIKARLATVDLKSHLIAVVQLESQKANIKKFVAMGKQMAPEMGKFLDAADHLKGVVITANLGGGPLLKVNLDAYNEQSAGELNKLVTEGLNMGKSMYQQAKGAMTEELPPAMAEPLVKMTDQLVAGIAQSQQGSQVSISLAAPKEMMASLEKMVQQGMKEAQQAAADMRQSNNFKQLALAMHFHHDTYNGLPPATIKSKDGKPLLSWRVALLPYLEYEDLYKKFKLDEPWDSEHNKALIAQMPPQLTSPGVSGIGNTSVVVITGKGLPFGGEKGPRFRDIEDGQSQTIMIALAGPDKAVPWTKPADVEAQTGSPAATLGKLDPKGILVALFDGSTRLLRRDISAEVWRSLIDGKDGNPIDWSAVNANFRDLEPRPRGPRSGASRFGDEKEERREEVGKEFEKEFKKGIEKEKAIDKKGDDKK